MRINRFIAQATGMSRRTADKVIQDGRVLIDGHKVDAGQQVIDDVVVTLDGKTLQLATFTTIVLHKPVGYVCSRNGQGSNTVYDLLPQELHNLKPVGRLDKDSSGLLLLTNDGELAQNLTHPSNQKSKRYNITLDKSLQPLHRQMIQDIGIHLSDGNSRFIVERRDDDNDHDWVVILREGKNRQIRRTFDALGYTVIKLHRTHFGDYILGDLAVGQHKITS